MGLSKDSDDLWIQELLNNGRVTWYCDSNIAASGNGLDWATAFKIISEAVAAASAL